ncbi:adenylate kinase 8 isoform X7 [Physeter macrocephalus]|uniref:Adenylate kinase 8 isoform X7 n=1 Tax=Physeter macrocephalus TaxID=9755 RepID=A0A455BVK6_PHYMC|nr:adenylate kinase 8 isoform X7 [Physeter catodon]|eukprot:XP_028353030.1 adenylate kinase 8 isoform X7 [Physeter catodon]
MDATTAPHRIPPEMPQYGEANHVFELMQNMLEQLLIHQPKDPIPFMIDHLQRDNDYDGAQHAARQTGSGTPEGRGLHQAEIYHATFDWPPEPEIQKRLIAPAGISGGETARRLLAYHRNIARLLPSYPKILKVIAADQPCVDVFYQALTYVQTIHPSNAPFTPRVLLCGPVGSGRSLQAALLAQKYGLVNVCCGQLLKEAVADKSEYGELIRPFFEKETAVPDNITMKVLKRRLDRQDCVERGWVLHGFPRDGGQALLMDSMGYKPNRVFFLNVPFDSILERLTLRRTDPVTGERSHLMYKPPPTMEIQARLLQSPKDSEEQIKLRMDRFYRNSAELEEFYGQAITLNGDQDPYTVFEYIESGIINPLRKKAP